MTKKAVTTAKVTLPSIETLRKEESLRLHLALTGIQPGDEAYTKILSQITALNAHARAVELKEADLNRDLNVENAKAVQVRDLESQKAFAALELEREKQIAARQTKQFELVGKLITVGLILVFEHSGHAIISKSFGLIRD